MLHGLSQQQQSDAEIASWDTSRAYPWSQQTLPPLALVYKRKIIEDGVERCEFMRLRLILVAPEDIRSARQYVPALATVKVTHLPLSTALEKWRNCGDHDTSWHSFF